MSRRIVFNERESQGKQLAELFKCTPVMVSYSLNFKTNSMLARKIRKAALERGGIDTGAINQQKNEL
jgi:hypothetical protein